MSRGRIMKAIGAALLVLTAFPLMVVADSPPPGGPSIQSPRVMANESFEALGVFPPSGWTLIRTNARQTWRALGLPYLMPYSGHQSAIVLPDPKDKRQDEVLLTPKIYAPNILLLFSTMTRNVTKCKPVDGVCDLQIWLVRGAWGPGGGADKRLERVDDSWTENDGWVRGSVSIPLESMGIYEPIRIGFRYVGKEGGGIALDDVSAVAYDQLNKNWSFERGGTMATGWKGRNLTAQDKRDNTRSKSGSWSFRMVGSSADKSLFQTIAFPGHAYDTLTVSGCSRSEYAKAGRPYEVVAIIYHLDGSKESHKIKFSSGSHGWQCKSDSFLTKEAYKRIGLEIRYWKQGGKAWFDDVWVNNP